MIGFLRGKLAAKMPPWLTVDVQGVGYELEAPMTTFYLLPAVGEEVTLYTHLVVREDAHALFGFATLADRVLFRALIKVNGVGPKLALTLLSGLSAEAFQQCIQNNDMQVLVRLPGVGKKTAERLVIEMRDRLPSLGDVAATAGSPVAGSSPVPLMVNPKQEAISALCSLGYKPPDASRMVQALDASNKSCEDLIRLALQGAAR
ncbi:MAG: Holliday junction branch migration protein RuvA [Methylococcaceae bacterium]|nr:Holliday junction branch migration protein RuvA [Methylococcaceae bacterium]